MIAQQLVLELAEPAPTWIDRGYLAERDPDPEPEPALVRCPDCGHVTDPEDARECVHCLWGVR